MLFLEIVISLLISFHGPNYEVPDKEVQQEILEKVNAIRARGCTCGNKYYAPAAPLSWHNSLYQSALSHAREMARYSFFGHYGIRGEDIGTRVDRFNYPWEVVGENLGEGQRSFNEVLRDWVESPSHCKMLMDPRVKEMAVARYRRYWVQHFGKRVQKIKDKKS